MEMMVDHELANNLPLEEYPVLDEQFECGFFMGYLIKNLYDEKRFKINKKYSPQRFTFNSNNGPYRLYGILNNKKNTLIDSLVSNPPQNIGEYSSVLSVNEASCLTCFLHFSPGLYPLDNDYVQKVFSDIDLNEFNSNKNILPFQRIGHIYIFALVNHNFL
jgi:hypothetical protein